MSLLYQIQAFHAARRVGYLNVRFFQQAAQYFTVDGIVVDN